MLFRSSMRTNASHFSPQMGKSPKNQEQVMTENALAGSNGAAGMTLFFQSWKNDYKEFVRRICNKNYPAGHPGYAEVLEFRKRCLRRGVPMEAIWAVDVNAIQINQGLGHITLGMSISRPYTAVLKYLTLRYRSFIFCW